MSKNALVPGAVILDHFSTQSDAEPGYKRIALFGASDHKEFAAWLEYGIRGRVCNDTFVFLNRDHGQSDPGADMGFT